MKRDHRSFASFYLEFWHENAKPKRSKGVCTRLTVGKEVCRSFGRRKHVARHRNYRLVESPFTLPPKNEKLLTAEKLPPYFVFYRFRPKTKNYRRMALPPYFGFTASVKVITAKKKKHLPSYSIIAEKLPP